MRTVNLRTMTMWERDMWTNKLSEIQIDRKPLPSNYHIYLQSCDHIGNTATSEKASREFIRTVKSKRKSFVIHHGDALETIAHYDKRYSLDVHENRMNRIDAQRDAFIKLYWPIRHRYLGFAEGNHEAKIRNIVRPTKDIAEMYGSIYANGKVLKFLFPGFNLMAVHGWGNVRSKAGDALQRATNNLVMLKRKLRELPADDCDLITCGHYHQLWVHPPVSKQVLYTDPKTNRLKHTYSQPGRIPLPNKEGAYRVPEDERWYVCCGSFLRSYMEDMPTYPEDYGLRPAELGFGHIEVRNDKPVVVETIPLGLGD